MYALEKQFAMYSYGGKHEFQTLISGFLLNEFLIFFFKTIYWSFDIKFLYAY